MSEGFTIANVRNILEEFATVESRQIPYAPLPVEVDSHTTRCQLSRVDMASCVDRPFLVDRASQVDSGPSTSSVYPLASTNTAPSSTNEIEVGQI